MDSEVLLSSRFQRHHVLGVLHVSLQRLGNTSQFDELLNRHRSSVEAFNRVLKTIEYGVQNLSRVEPFETVPLDILDAWWGRVLPIFDTAYLEVVVTGDPQRLRRRRVFLVFERVIESITGF